MTTDQEYREIRAARSAASRLVHPLDIVSPDQILRGKAGEPCEFRLNGNRYRVERARSGNGWSIWRGPTGPMDPVSFSVDAGVARTAGEALNMLVGRFDLSNPTAMIHTPQRAAPTPLRAETASRQDRRPRLPPRASFIERGVGVGYLTGRGIPRGVIQHAEQAGFLRIIPDGVAFVSRDAKNEVRCVEVRKPGEKRALSGSKKGFPGVLPGNPEKVLIVEGGVDALAAHALAAGRGSEPPTVIITHGAGLREGLRQPHIAELLRHASEIVVASDNERTPQIQGETDELHRMQVEVAQEISPHAAVRLWHPPSGRKDLGEMAQARAQQAPAPTTEPEPRPARGIRR